LPAKSTKNERNIKPVLSTENLTHQDLKQAANSEWKIENSPFERKAFEPLNKTKTVNRK
jgi:hypothetical protein